MMNDAEYIFKQTEIERKKNGYGDRHKKRQGGKTVRFPSDYLTKKEREAMSGEVITYKDKPFYTREEFQELPDDLRLKWVNSIINRYGVALTGVSRIIFGQRDWLTSRVDLQYVNKGAHGQGAAKGNRKLEADYAAFLEAQKQPSEAQEESKKVGIDNITALAMVLDSLRGTGARVTIEVTL